MSNILKKALGCAAVTAVAVFAAIFAYRPADTVLPALAAVYTAAPPVKTPQEEAPKRMEAQRSRSGETEPAKPETAKPETPSAAYQIQGVENIYQLPELPRGCEVTSLAMLMNFLGVPADKIVLADEIAKDDAPHYRKDGKIYAGDPNDGFVGDMLSLTTYGLGVYHSPVYDLLKKYIGSAVDLTGCDFGDLYEYIAGDRPVWVVTNATFNELGADSFETWVTPNGEIQITYREHSVLVTGYDEEKIYFADPLSGNSDAGKDGFIKAWEQMGRQAVSVEPQTERNGKTEAAR